MPALILEQLHIDVARNATDDFNPFHDLHRWQNIHANPFDGPIALGFQLAGLALDRISQHRDTVGEGNLAWANKLFFSNYQFTFASAVTANSELEVQVRRTSNRIDARGELSNRVMLKTSGRLALMGMRRDTRRPTLPLRFPSDIPFALEQIEDRTILPGSGYFLKRKYLMTSNGKNFCAGCFIPQHHYFDELADKVYFPPAFVLSLVSCALLERAWSEGHDFEARPYLYTNHTFSFDKRLQRQLKSNDRIHLLVSGAENGTAEDGLGNSGIPQIQHHCYGILNENQVLFHGRVGLAELEDVLKQKKR